MKIIHEDCKRGRRIQSWGYVSVTSILQGILFAIKRIVIPLDILSLSNGDAPMVDTTDSFEIHIGGRTWQSPYSCLVVRLLTRDRACVVKRKKKILGEKALESSVPSDKSSRKPVKTSVLADDVARYTLLKCLNESCIRLPCTALFLRRVRVRVRVRI